MQPATSKGHLNKEQEEVLFESFVLYPPVGGKNDGRICERKSDTVFAKALLDYKERVPPLIAAYEKHNAVSAKDSMKTYKATDLVDAECVKRAWKRWGTKYKAVVSKYQVSQEVKKGQTCLAGDEALPKSATDAITKATEEGWHLFAAFHAEWGHLARFNVKLTKSTLTLVKAVMDEEVDVLEEDPQQLDVGTIGLPLQEEEEGCHAVGAGVADALGGRGPPAADAPVGAAGNSAGRGRGTGAPQRKTAIAASVAMALAISSDTEDGEGAPQLPEPQQLEPESSWVSTIEGELVNPLAPGAAEIRERKARHVKRKAAREAIEAAVVGKRTKGSAGGGKVARGSLRGASVARGIVVAGGAADGSKAAGSGGGGSVAAGSAGGGGSECRKSEGGFVRRESVRDRRIAEQVETKRGDTAKEVEKIRGENFGNVMRAVTEQKVDAMKKQTEAMIAVEREKNATVAAIAKVKAETAASIASASNEQQTVAMVYITYMRQHPDLSPGKAMKKAREAVAGVAAGEAAVQMQMPPP